MKNILTILFLLVVTASSGQVLKLNNNCVTIDANCNLSTTGNINITARPYGELYRDADGLVVNLGTSGVFFTIKGLTTGLTNGGVTLTDSTIQVANAGVYRLVCSVSLAADAPNDFYLISLFNGVDGNTNVAKAEGKRKLGSTGDVGNITFTCLFSATANDILKMKITCTSGSSKTVTIDRMNFNISKVN